ncbi:MAG: OmpH family outer membrane protein [Prevotella sp.]|nr:OmpH family outer membrane protein [Prevotella sp.]
MKKLIICAICAICGFTTANAQKFGHVNTQEIIQAMPEFVKAQSELKSLQEQYEADLKAIQDEIQKKGEAFEKEQATLPDNIKQRRQQELQEMYQKYQQSAQDNQQALYKAQQDKMQVVSGKLYDAIKAVGQEGGYVYIMQTSVQEVIPYISTTLSTDVTAQVKAKLGLK